MSDPTWSRGFDGLALIFWVVWLVFGWLFVDVTDFGPPQSEVFYAAEQLASADRFPRYDVPFLETFSLGAAATYLEAPPLVFGEEPGAVHRWNWLLTFAALAFLIRRVRAAAGSVPAAFIAALAPPHFLWLNLSMAGSVGLLFPVGCLIAAWALSLWQGRDRSAIWLSLTLAIAVQLHPGALPLVLGFVVFAFRYGDQRWIRPIVLGVLLGLIAYLPWLIAEVAGGFRQTQAAFDAIRIALIDDFVDFFSADKWLAWAIQPSLIAAASRDLGSLHAQISLGFQLVVLTGALAGAFMSAAGRALALPAAVWLLLAVGPIEAGSYRHTDVVWPLILVMSALGLSRVGTRVGWLGGIASAAIFAFNLGLAFDLKKSWHDRGRLRLAQSTLTFPASAATRSKSLVDYSRALEIYRGLAAAAIPDGRVAGADHAELLRHSNGWYGRLLELSDGQADRRCAVVVDQSRWQTPELLEHAPGSIEAGRLTAFLMRRCEVYESGDVRVSGDGRLLSVQEPTVLMAFMACDQPTAVAGAALMALNGRIEPDVQRRRVARRQYHLLTWSLSPRRGPFRYREPLTGACVSAGPAVAFPRRQTSNG